MTMTWAHVTLLVVIFAGGVAVGGLCVSLAGSRREDRAYDEGRADVRHEERSELLGGNVLVLDEHDRPVWADGARLEPLRRAVPQDHPGPGRPEQSAVRLQGDGSEAGTGPGADEWAPQPEDRVYQWAHPHPIRATAPLTVIDWDALPWEERQLLTVWDWGRRMQAWVEDWDRERLEAA